jgi:hypothetical protein
MTIEQLAKEIAMFKDDCVDPEDMLIDYNSVRVGDVYELIQEAREEERSNIKEDIKTICRQLPMIAHSKELIKRYSALTTPLTDKDV